MVGKVTVWFIFCIIMWLSPSFVGAYYFFRNRNVPSAGQDE